MTSKDWVDPIESSARELLKKGMARMPELRGLFPEEAFEVVKAEGRLAADEQDVSLYEKATSPRYVLLVAVLLQLASILGFVLFWATAFAVGKRNLARRAGGAITIALAVGAFHPFIKAYRGRTPRRIRPYVLKALERRAARSAT